MPDPKLLHFYKISGVKKIPEFSRLQWLSDAAGRAEQLSLTTHPFAFTHPCARRNRYGKAGAILAEVKKKMMAFCDPVMWLFRRMLRVMLLHWKYIRF